MRKPTFKMKKHSPPRNKPGTAPGTLAAAPEARATKITVIAYKPDDILEKIVGDLTEIETLRRDWPMLWISVEGLGSADRIGQLGKMFGLHPLALEDAVGQHQRPKAEAYDGYLFVVTEKAKCQGDDFEAEQVNLFIGASFLITMQETPHETKPVLARLRGGSQKRERFMHADYLAYSIVDTLIDEFFPLLDHFSDRLDTLEEEVVARPRRQLIADTHVIKRELQQIRHALWPMREMINNFSSATELVHEETRPYLRDCYDHIIQIVDIVETYRERASSLVDIYLSSMANRTNEVMRVLTIISTIFMPLSFIASLYGMNFDTGSKWNMPELHWKYGYPYALGLMTVVTILLLLYFRRKGWFTPAEEADPTPPR